LIQRAYREHLDLINYKLEKIQSLWRGYWLRKVIYVRLLMFYKGQCLIDHLLNFYSMIAKRHFKHFCYKISFRKNRNISYKFLSDQMDLIGKMKMLNLTGPSIKRNVFEKNSLKIQKGTNFTFEGLIDKYSRRSTRVSRAIQESEKKFEKLYYDLLKKYEEIKEMTHQFDMKKIKMAKKNIVFEILSSEEEYKNKYMKQAFYLKESKINKDKSKEEEELNEGEMLFPDKQSNKTISDIQQDEIQTRGRRYIRSTEEVKSKDSEEYRPTQRRYRRYVREEEDTLSVKTKDSKISVPKKLFDNIQMDFSFKNINIVTKKKKGFNVVRKLDKFTIKGTMKSQSMATPKRGRIQIRSESKFTIKGKDKIDDRRSSKISLLKRGRIQVRNESKFTIKGKEPSDSRRSSRVSILKRGRIQIRSESKFTISGKESDRRISLISPKRGRIVARSVNTFTIRGKEQEKVSIRKKGRIVPRSVNSITIEGKERKPVFIQKKVKNVVRTVSSITLSRKRKRKSFNFKKKKNSTKKCKYFNYWRNRT